jgi:hypothetical protein
MLESAAGDDVSSETKWQELGTKEALSHENVNEGAEGVEAGNVGSSD